MRLTHAEVETSWSTLPPVPFRIIDVWVPPSLYCRHPLVVKCQTLSNPSPRYMRGFLVFFFNRVLLLPLQTCFVKFFFFSVVLRSRGERVGNLLAPVGGADQHNHGASGDGQAQRPRRLVACVVAHCLLDLVEDEVHQRVVSLEGAGDCKKKKKEC